MPKWAELHAPKTKSAVCTAEHLWDSNDVQTPHVQALRNSTVPSCVSRSKVSSQSKLPVLIRDKSTYTEHYTAALTSANVIKISTGQKIASEKQLSYGQSQFPLRSKREREGKETFDFTGKFILSGSSMQHTFKLWQINKNKCIHYKYSVGCKISNMNLSFLPRSYQNAN